MYMWSLYIGLGATVLSYLYLGVIPYYVQRVDQGAAVDETLWWQTIWQVANQKIALIPLVLFAVVVSLSLASCALYKPWLDFMPLMNVVVTTIWLGGLLLLARIDQCCFLLPDVLTQLLLWCGLWVAAQQSADVLTEYLQATIMIYLLGRSVNLLGFFWLKKPLFGQGDVKLLAAVAAWLGLSATIAVFFWASVLCVVLEALRQRCWRPSGSCAFGPYLVVATLLVWGLPSVFLLTLFNV